MSYKSNDENIKGPFILWVDYGYEGWKPRSFNTIKEALEAEKYSAWTITKTFEFEVTECPQT